MPTKQPQKDDLSARALIDEHGGASAFGRKTGLGVMNAHNWRRRNRIPAEHDDAIIKTLGISLERLAAARRVPKPRAGGGKAEAAKSVAGLSVGGVD